MFLKPREVVKVVRELHRIVRGGGVDARGTVIVETQTVKSGRDIDLAEISGLFRRLDRNWKERARTQRSLILVRDVSHSMGGRTLPI